MSIAFADELYDVVARFTPEQARAKLLRRSVPVFAVFVLLISVIVLGCWAMGGAGFQAAWPSVFVMKTNTAISLSLLALALLGVSMASRGWRLLATLASAAVLLLMSLIVLEYLCGKSLGIDQILFTDHAPVMYPGRTSPVSCMAFVLIGLALLLAARGRAIAVSQALCFVSIAAPLSGFGGYLYNAPGLSSSSILPIISFYTAVCQLLLAFGGFTVRPDQGLMKLMVSESLAGSTARKLIPLAVLLPVGAGLVITMIERAALVSVPFGSALLVACCAMFFSAGVWQTTVLLWSTEKTRAAAELERETTERLLNTSANRYRTLFSNIDQGFCVIEMVYDSNGVAIDYRFIEINPAFEKQSGLRDATGRLIRDMAPSHEAFWLETYSQVAKTGEPVRLEHQAVALDRWFEVHALSVGEAEPDRVAVVFSDITDRKIAEAERERLLAIEQAARAESEAAGRMKDEFLATLSHELRTPLNAIVGWTHLLKTRGNDESNLAEGLAVIDRNARAQAQIIEDILDMSRIISGKLRLDVQRVDLAALVQAGVDTVQPAADAKAIQLQVMLDPTGTQINGDANRLHQIFWNLLSNAVKFTPKGGRVQVVLQRVSSHIEVSIVDTGEGIDANFLPHVFDRFRQADASTTRRHGGLGLGLAIVKQLVELHGGSVGVKSPGNGKGSTFTVTLPLTIFHADSVEPPTSAEHPVARAALDARQIACKQLAGITIVVVDDEADARDVIRRTLEDCGAVVRTAGSAAEALTLIQIEMPKVLISDIGMPEQDGYELIRQVRALPASMGGQLPAAALTAYARAVDRIRSLEAGFQMHLSKPVEPVELVVTVATLAKLSTPVNTT